MKKSILKKIVSLILILTLVLGIIPVYGEANAATENTEAYELGDIILFGKYEQDGNLENGTEPIEWMIYEITDNDLYLISYRALFGGAINEYEKGKAVTWENCSLRNTLNNDFLKTAFNDEEALLIEDTELSDTGTVDKVFLPSQEELEKEDSILEKDFRIRCAPTDFATDKLDGSSGRVWTCTGDIGDGDVEHLTMDREEACYWWLRTAKDSSKFAVVDEAGYFTAVKYWGYHIKSYHRDYDGEDEHVTGYGIRPALRISLSEETGKLVKKTGNTIAPKTVTSETVREIIVNTEDAKQGDVVAFGHYEQDNDPENGEESIKWLVLARSGSELLLLSKYGLDVKPYNTKKKDITWAKCTLRSWLNDDFYNKAFSKSEKEQIKTTTVRNDRNPIYGTSGGKTTKDKVFLLSMDDILNNSFGFSANTRELDINRSCGLTAYALAQGATSGDDRTEDGVSGAYWWLRTPGDFEDCAVFVQPRGYLRTDGMDVDKTNYVIRPVIVVKLKNDGKSDSSKTQVSKAKSLKKAKVGDTILFGSYEQDNNTKNGKEPIEWMVLSKNKNYVLVTSKYILDAKPFNTKNTKISWFKSSLRKWLNNDFLNGAFTKEEISKIKKSNISIEENIEFSKSKFEDYVYTVEDRVFLLSLRGISNSKYGFCSDYKYLEDNSNRIVEATPYAAKKGASSWWLRTLGGKEGNRACYVDKNGVVNAYGEKIDNSKIGIRPALMIGLK